MDQPRPMPHHDHVPPESGDYWSEAGSRSQEVTDEARTLQLRREELVATKEMRHIGDVEIRTEIEHVPGRLEVEAFREEVEVEHVPVGRVVGQREGPREEGDVLIVPVYEEQLVVTKRLMLREELRIRRVPCTDTQMFEDDLRRERLVIEDIDGQPVVHEQYPTEGQDEQREGFFENLKRKVMQP